MIKDVMHEAEIPDGALYLELGATLNPDGGDPLPKVDLIWNSKRQYRRAGGELMPFPECIVRLADIAWRPKEQRDGEEVNPAG